MASREKNIVGEELDINEIIPEYLTRKDFFDNKKPLDVNYFKTMYNVYINTLRMLKERGYDVTDKNNIAKFGFDKQLGRNRVINKISLKDFIEYFINKAKEENIKTFKEALTFKQKPNKTSFEEETEIIEESVNIRAKKIPKLKDVHVLEPILIYFANNNPNSDNLIKQDIQKVLLAVKNQKVNRVIVISEQQIYSQVRNFLKNKCPVLILQHFFHKELSFVLIDHNFVPKHELLTEKEANELLRINKLAASNLPEITVHDPVSKFYGAEPGQIFKIYRTTLFFKMLVMNYVTYRFVVDKPLRFKEQKLSNVELLKERE